MIHPGGQQTEKQQGPEAGKGGHAIRLPNAKCNRGDIPSFMIGGECSSIHNARFAKLSYVFMARQRL